MDTTALKQEIIDIVNENGPIKPTELVVKITTPLSGICLSEVIDELVRNGDIFEVVYQLPLMNYRVKSLLFPKGTVINIIRTT